MESIARLALVVTLLAGVPAVHAAARVAVSIAPLHSLVAGVTAGVSEPDLLVPGGVSPHTYTLRPSDARALAAADLVVWVGPDLERFLDKPLAGRSPQALLTAMRLPGITLREAREGGAWEGHADHVDEGGHAGGHDEDDGHHHDPHLWLDPLNARRLVEAVAAALSRLDPGNAAAYAANRERMVGRLDALHARLDQQLAPVRERPFVVFHDAYYYFEARYGLNAAGSVTVSAERAPGARRLNAIRAKVRSLGATCVFAEPQFRPTLVSVVLEGSGARLGLLDPVGAQLAPGPDLYFELLQGLADGLAGCLAQP
jgi:zinc transport system substrate-binding protein